MFHTVFELLKKEGIGLFGALSLSDCTITRPYLLEREGITGGSVLPFAMPYYTPACDAPDRNISSYAVGKDYHAYFEGLKSRLIPEFHARFQSVRITAFADRSPIDEREAAAMAGLGMLGQNGLLITEPYSSYIFLGEVILDVPLPEGISTKREIAFCEGCGKCKAACPYFSGKLSGCLSEVTQKKGTLSESEISSMLAHGTAWGCDICSEVCPHTESARRNGTLYTPISFFYENTIPHLTGKILSEMEEGSFLSRAYSWRGKQTIERNLRLFDGAKE